VLKVLWYVLTTGCRWRDVPPEMGCSGETARGRLIEWEDLGVWGRVHLDFLRLLRKDGDLEHDTAIVDSVLVRAHGGGSKTGPSPVDRGKPGCKYSLMVDRGGAALGVKVAGANASDHTQILPLVREEFPRVGGQPGRPRTKPKRLYADAGYDSEPTRNVLRCLGIEPFIRKRGAPHGSGLGTVRWVVERTIGWVKGLRRLRVRYDRRDEAIEAWNTLAMAVVNFRLWQHALADET
jgi:transposase